eukprot:PhM_4_TR17407/c0_g1_i2/m.82183
MPFTNILASLVYLTVIAIVVGGQVTLPSVTICNFPLLDDIESVFHATFAVKYYAPQFPAVQWRHHNIHTVNDPSVRNIIFSWIVNGTGCDVLVGPGFSYLALGISPVVNIPWIDPSSTSTELSVKMAHPTFSRTIPTDEVGGKLLGAIYRKFNWRQTNILCSEDTYGRSVAAGVASAIAEIDGVVEVSRCFEKDASYERVRAAVETVLASNTRVTFIAGLYSDPWYAHFKTVVEELRAYDKIIFLLSEVFCSSSDKTYLAFTGSICATYSAAESVMGPFLSSYRNMSTRTATELEAELADLASMGFSLDEMRSRSNGTNIYATFMHDSVLHGMSSLNSYYSNGTAQLMGVDKIKYLREHVTYGGATGAIRLDENGDRRQIDAVIYNVQPGQREVMIGHVRNATFVQDGSSRAVHLLGRTSVDIPTARRPVAEEDSGLDIIPIVVPVTVVCVAVVVATVVLRISTQKSRNNHNAVTDSSQPFTVVFTDIQASTTLWAREPVAMSEALEAHHLHIRKGISRCRGYEVKTIGDSFMCVFRDRADALKFALDVQQSLYEATWPSGLDDVYKHVLTSDGVELPPDYTWLWNGLRVRVGLNYGSGSIQLDPVTLGYDYYGTVVNTAARVEGVAHGGQVVATAAVLEGLDITSLGVLSKDLGAQPLRGLDEPLQLFQIGRIGSSLNRREFPPLRLDHGGIVLEDPDEVGGDVEVASETCSSINQSDSSTFSSADVILHAANKYVRVNDSVATAQSLVDLHAYTKTLFSTKKEAWRHKTVTDLAQSWRVPQFAKRKITKNGRDYDLTILDIVWKALTATRVNLGQGSATNSEKDCRLAGFMTVAKEAQPSLLHNDERSTGYDDSRSRSPATFDNVVPVTVPPPVNIVDSKPVDES